jgi:hypothetical protein
VDAPLTTSSPLLSRRGLWFDVAVLAGNIFLLGPMTELANSADDFNPRFGILLIVAAILYAIGAGFKRRPLQARIASAKLPLMSDGMMIIFFILMVMHLGLFMLCAMVGAEMIHGTPVGGALMGRWQVAEAVMLIILAVAPTVMTVGALLHPRTPLEPSPALDRREMLADIFLYASCMIILAWWNGSLAELFAGVKAALPMRILLVVLVTVPFSIFYLAPRILFLLEDYRYLRTWFGILLVMLPLAVRIVVSK